MVELAQAVAGHAVGGDEDPAGLQDPRHLGEEAILELRRRDVVEHEERRRSREPVVVEVECRGVPARDLDVGAGVPIGEAHGQLGMDLHRRHPLHELTQVVGRGAVARPDLEQVRPEVGVAEDGRKDVGAQFGPPFVAGAELLVALVHSRNLGVLDVASDASRRAAGRRHMATALMVWIDQDLCTGDGICEEICGDVFTARDDGLWVVKEEAKHFGSALLFDGKDGDGHGPDGGRGVARIPDSLIDSAVEAAEECPGECIMIEPYDQAAIDARGA